jgi:N-acetylglutamate synthase-like GNAT family acetyltransferase
MSPPFQPREGTAGDVGKIKHFLRVNGLPDLGVDEWVQNFLIIEDENGSCVGVAGLELYGQSGLLRSVVVARSFRNKGHGRTLVTTVLADAKSRGLKKIYLLTDDARGYFERLGFQVVDRRDVDDAVKTSLEFTTACPESATVMRKIVG